MQHAGLPQADGLQEAHRLRVAAALVPHVGLQSPEPRQSSIASDPIAARHVPPISSQSDWAHSGAREAHSRREESDKSRLEASRVKRVKVKVLPHLG